MMVVASWVVQQLWMVATHSTLLIQQPQQWMLRVGEKVSSAVLMYILVASSSSSKIIIRSD